jgi:hypothetical protein
MNGFIVRLEHTPQGDIGVVLFDGIVFCFCLQPDVVDAGRFHLPEGLFNCRRYDSPKHGETFVIERPETPFHVDGHDFLEFHAGNVLTDTLGCTIIGSSVDKLKGQRAVVNSGTTFKLFMEKLEGIDSFPLKVIDCYTV